MDATEQTPIVNVHSHYHAGESMQLVRERAREWGVVRYVMSATRPDGDVSPNDCVRKAMRENESFIVGLYLLDLDNVTPDEVARARADGFGGFKIINTLRPYDWEGYFRHYEAIEDVGMPILFHTGFLSVLPSQRRSTAGMLNWRPGTLDTLARAFPGLKMIGAHLGSPWFLEALSVALYHKNVYFDLSGGAVRANSLPFFRRIFSLRDASTPDVQGHPLPPDDDRPSMQLLGKMMFGTDNPSPERICPFVARLLGGLGADEDTRRRVYYRNACEVFSLEL